MRFVWVQWIYWHKCKCHSVALSSLKMHASPVERGLYWHGSRANSLPVGCMSTAQLFPSGKREGKHITRGFIDTVDNRMNTFRVVLFDGCTSKNFPMWHHKVSERKKQRASLHFFPKPVKLLHATTNTVSSGSSVEEEGKSSVTTSKIQALHRIRVTHFAVKWPRILLSRSTKEKRKSWSHREEEKASRKDDDEWREWNRLRASSRPAVVVDGS